MNKPKRWILLGGLVGLLAMAPLPVSAKPKGRIFLETMAVSTSVGLILGASTLPFYQSPGSNLVNLAYGAAAGVLVGLGLFTYEWLAGWPSSQEMAKAIQNRGEPGVLGMQDSSLQTTRAQLKSDTLIWAPIVSLRW